jgi:DNA-binding LacI/PurR family transcriptional regulator
LYEQIKKIVLDRIQRGDYKPNDCAPTEAELISEFRVSSTTARRCLNDLEHEGFVQRVQGKGTFVRERDALATARHFGIFYHELANLTSTFAASTLNGIFGQVGHSRFQPDLLSSASVRRSANPSAALAELVRQRHIDGLMVLSPTPLPWFKDLLATGMPIVSVNIEYDHPRIFGVINDLWPEIERTITDMIVLGHRRIVALKEVYPETLTGVVSSQLPDWSRRPDFECEFETVSYSNPAQVRAIVEKHMSSGHPPTAFAVYGYEPALEVRHVLRSLKLSVPQDISMVLLGAAPGPTSFHQIAVPAEEIGAEATRILFTLLAGHVPVDRVTRVPIPISLGETLGRAPSRPSIEAAASQPVS